MNKNNNARDTKTLVIELYCRTIFTKPVLYCQYKNYQTCRSIKGDNVNKCIELATSYLTKHFKNTHNGIISIFNKCCLENRKFIVLYLPHAEQ